MNWRNESQESTKVLEVKTSCTENDIVDELILDIKQLSSKRQQYYYHRVKADLIDEEL